MSRDATHENTPSSFESRGNPLNVKLKRVVAGVAALAVVAGTPLLTASAAFAAGTLKGAAQVKTAGGVADLNAGDSDDTFTLRLPNDADGTAANCLKDGNNGGRWHAYMIPGSEVPANMTFAANGAPTPTSVGTGGVGTFRNNVYSTTGTPVRAQAPSLGDANIINIPNMNFSSVWTDGQIPAGVYNIGIACTDANNANAMDNFWNQKITVTYPGGDNVGPRISWKVGVVANAPTLTGVTPANGKLTASFTPEGSDPADTGYTVEATDGTATFTATGTTSPIDLTVPNWRTYSVRVKATNFVGDSPFSNTVSNVRVPKLTAPVVTASDDLVNKVQFAWAAQPVDEPTPDGYTVAVTPDPGAALTVNLVSRTGSIDPASPGSYLIQVTPTYDAGTNTGLTGSDTGIAVSSTLLYQNIDVGRPVGALVLTQVCGVNGRLPAEPATAVFNALPEVPAADSSTVMTPSLGGIAPTTDGTVAAGPDGTIGTPDDGAHNGSALDAEPKGSTNYNKPEYPYPTDAAGKANPNYPTFCGIDLNEARFVTRGPGAGQFFATDGVISQVTVVDTTDADTGWTVTGKMSDFTANGGTDAFSGSQLGWSPQVTEVTPTYTDSKGSTYTSAADDGDDVAPNTAEATGLSAGKRLADANARSGLGTTILDARLKLLIPVTADAGDYTSTLTITATSKAP